MKRGVVVLPVLAWPEAERVWRELEDLGFDSAWTYDHVEWHGWRDRPWYAAYPLLAAVAARTSRIRIGTLVTSTNLHHPVTLAHQARTVDEIAGGRFELGVGAGGLGPDATVLGNEPWTARERVDRFAELVSMLDDLLTAERTTVHGEFYSATDAPMFAPSRQAPRIPFTIAADGPRSMRVVVAHGQRWVANLNHGALEAKVDALDAACAAAGRDPATLPRVLLVDEPTSDLRPRQVHALLGRAERLGFEELVLRHPLDGDRRTLEAFASRE